MKQVSSAMAALALAVLVPLAGCGKAADEDAAAEQNDVNRTLAAAIADAPDLSRVSQALSDTGLLGMFDGPGSYTVLAPDDDAFAQLGEGREELSSPEGKSIMVAVLRGHIVPGHLTPESIREAVENRGGPVKMRTLGEGTVTFSVEGDAIRVESDEGMSATVDGAALTANNGAVIPLDGLLKAPQPQPRA